MLILFLSFYRPNVWLFPPLPLSAYPLTENSSSCKGLSQWEYLSTLLFPVLSLLTLFPHKQNVHFWEGARIEVGTWNKKIEWWQSEPSLSHAAIFLGQAAFHNLEVSMPLCKRASSPGHIVTFINGKINLSHCTSLVWYIACLGL